MTQVHFTLNNEEVQSIIVDCIIKRDRKKTCYDTLKLTYQS